MDAAATNSWGGIGLIGFLLLGGLFGFAVIVTFVAAFFHGMRNSHAEERRVGSPVPNPVVERSGPGYRALVSLWVLGLIAVLALAAGYVITYPDGVWQGFTHRNMNEFLIVFGSLIGILLMSLTVARLVWVNRRRWAAALTYAHPVSGADGAKAAPPVGGGNARRRTPNLWLAWVGIVLAGYVLAALYMKTEVVTASGEERMRVAPLLMVGVIVVGGLLLRGVIRRTRADARPAAQPPESDELPEGRGPWITGKEVRRTLLNVLLFVVAPAVGMWYAMADLPKGYYGFIPVVCLGLFVIGMIPVFIDRELRRTVPITPYDMHVRGRKNLGLPPALTREEFNVQLEKQLRENAWNAAEESEQPEPPPPPAVPPSAEPPRGARTTPVLIAALVMTVAGSILILVVKTRPPAEAQFLARTDSIAVPLLAAGVLIGLLTLVGVGIGLLIRSARRPKRKLSPHELEHLLKSVKSLTPQQRKVLFWAFVLFMSLAALAMLEPMFSKMGVGVSSAVLGFFIVSVMASPVLLVRDWAFKKKPINADVKPLPVAPLLLTPDPTPEGGNCPTCGGAIPTGSPHGLCPRCLMRGVMQSANATRVRPTRPIDPPPAAEVGEFFPHLEVLELIGAGGMGAVYKVRQPNLDRVVALKIVQSPTGDDDPVFAERFAREARAMAKLDHPNIVTIHESGEAGGLPYLLMEFVDGITLREAMTDKVLTTSEALAVIPQICDALDYAHKNGVVHRDIKPENILIDQTGRVKIADFGLAKLADPKGVSLTHTRQAMGTPHYMAPEQWEKPSTVDHRADIYALGVVLYELLTGELPLGRFDLPSAKGKGNAGMDQIILRALAKEPGQRYQHAGEVKTALSGLGDHWADAPRPKRRGYEYRSKATLLGWPLVHVVSGRDPRTGKHRTAKGWIAVGDVSAVGGIAVAGVVAIGGVTLAGVVSMGVLALGGAAAVGLIALGGTATGAAVAVGGVAVSAGLAVGGVAVAPWVIGGAGAGTPILPVQFGD